MKNKIILGIVIAVVVILGIYTVSKYNGFVSLNEGVDTQWAQVESQYQRRFDLIPNLVASVKGTMKQEQTVFQAIADARTKYSGATTINDKVKSAGEVESALGRLLVVMENYPTLKSSEAVSTLMAQMEGAENRISVERQRFNDMTKEYNVYTKRFPSNILSSIFGFDERNYFESQEASENAPKVEF